VQGICSELKGRIGERGKGGFGDREKGRHTFDLTVFGAGDVAIRGCLCPLFRFLTHFQDLAREGKGELGRGRIGISKQFNRNRKPPAVLLHL